MKERSREHTSLVANDSQKSFTGAVATGQYTLRDGTVWDKSVSKRLRFCPNLASSRKNKILVSQGLHWQESPCEDSVSIEQRTPLQTHCFCLVATMYATRRRVAYSHISQHLRRSLPILTRQRLEMDAPYFLYIIGDFKKFFAVAG